VSVLRGKSSDAGERAALDRLVAHGLRSVSAWVMLALLGFAVADIFLLPRMYIGLTVGLAAGSAIPLLALQLLLRDRRLPPRLSQPAAAGVIGLALANVLVRMVLAPDPRQTPYLALVALAAGAVFLSWRWLLPVLAAAVTSWVLVAVANPKLEWGYFGFVFAVAVTVAAVLHGLRLKMILGLERERRRFAGLIENALDVTLLVDHEGAIRYVSPSVDPVLGWNPDEMSRRSVLELVHPDDRDDAARLVTEQLQVDRRSEPVEVRFRCADGSWRVIEAVVNDRSDDPSVGGFVINARDITERKAAEEAVREADERLRALVDASPLAVLSADLDGTVRSWNPAAERIFGWTSEEAVGCFIPFVSPDRRKEFLDLRDRLIAVGGLEQEELMRHRKDGTQVPVSLSAAPLRDARGRATGIMAILADITERKRAEQELARATRQLEEAQRLAHVGSWEVDLAVSRAEWSREMLRMLEMEPASPGPGFDLVLQHVHPDDREPVAARVREAMEQGLPQRFEHRILAHDGKVRWLSISIEMETGEDGRPLRMLGTGQDVTERKRAEEALREAEARYRTLVERIPAITYEATFGFPAPWLYVSPQVQTILGYTQAEWLADPGLWLRLVHPEDVDRVVREENRSRDTGDPLVSEYRLVARDGRAVWVRDEAETVRDEAGGPGFLRGIMHDITERKRAEERLGEAEERFRMLVEQSPAVTFLDAVHHEDGRTSRETLYISPQVEEMLGYPVEQWLAEPDLWKRLLHPDEREVVEPAARQSNEKGTPFAMEYRLVARDGRTVWIHEESMPVSSEANDPRIWQGVMYDVTERKAAEEVLVESQAALEHSLAALRRANEERRKVLAHIVGAQEQERERIAEGVQDESLQQIVAVGMRLETLKRRLSDPEELGAVEQLGKSVERALERLRHVLTELRPRTLDTDGLGAALRQYLGEVCKDAELEFSVEDRFATEPPVELRVIAYRIAQETITSIRRRPGASRVGVLLEDRQGGYLVRVSGDGAASQPEPPDAAHVGVAAMRERAGVVGGWFRSSGNPGGGTTVEFWLPGSGSRSGS